LPAYVFRAKGAAGVKAFQQFCEAEYKNRNFLIIRLWRIGGGD